MDRANLYNFIFSTRDTHFSSIFQFSKTSTLILFVAFLLLTSQIEILLDFVQVVAKNLLTLEKKTEKMNK